MAGSKNNESHLGQGGTLAIDVRRFFQTGFERAGLLLMVVVAVALYGYMQSMKVKSVFTARASLRVVNESESSVEDVMGFRRAMMMQQPKELNTFAQSVSQREFLAELVDRHQLHLDPRFVGSSTNSMSSEQAVDNLQRMLRSDIRLNTLFLDVYATHSLPEVAQFVATTVAEEFVAFNLRRRVTAAKDLSKYLVTEAEQLKTKLEKADRAILDYKKQNDTVSFEDQKNSVSEEVNLLNQQYLQSKAERVQLESDLAEIRRLKDDVKTISRLPSVQSAPPVLQAKRLVTEQEGKVGALERVFKPKYPKLIDAKRELIDRRAVLDQAILEAVEFVDAAYSTESAREVSLQTALKETEKEALRVQELAIQYDIMVRDRNTDQAVYEAILRRIREAGMTDDFKRSRIELVESASLPASPSNAGVKARVSLYAIAGLCLACCMLLVFYFMDSSIKTVDEAEAYFGVPVLGAVPAGSGKNGSGSRRIMEYEPNSTCAEAFRSLRASIELLGPLEEKKLVAFTSADPGEGKSFACSNYAIAAAVQGRRTLLLDLDLRRPTVMESWEMDPECLGVSNVLRGDKTLDEAIQESPIESLSILPAGPLLPNPAEQLAGQRAKAMIAELRDRFDLVVVDTAPINAVADTLSVLPLVDVAAVVVKSGKTPRKGVARCLEMIARAGTKVDGTILNFLPVQAGYGYYYYYRSRDSYAADGVYGSKKKNA